MATSVPPLPVFQIAGQRGQDIYDQVHGVGPWAGSHPTRFEFYTSTNPACATALSKETDAILYNRAVLAGIVPKTPLGLSTYLNWANLGYANGMALNPDVYGPFYAWLRAETGGGTGVVVPSVTPAMQGAVNRSRWIKSIVKGNFYNSAYQPALDWVVADAPEADGTIQILGVRSIYQIGWAVDPLDGVLRRAEGLSPWVIHPDFGSATLARLSSGTESQGVLPGQRIRTFSQLSAQEKQVFSGPSSTPGGETYTPPPLIGTGSTAAPAPLPATPIPIPPDGSVIHVPNAGSGLEATIKLPGSDTFVPISAVPQTIWDAAAVAAAAPSQSGTPTGTPNLTVIGEGAADIGGGGTFTAGFGTGMGGLLAIAAIVGILLTAKKSRS